MNQKRTESKKRTHSSDDQLKPLINTHYASNIRPWHNDLFLEELRQLQAIITRFEEHTFKIRNWLFAFVGGFGLLLYSKESKLTWKIFLPAALVAIILFLWIELYHRAHMRFAILRVEKIEYEAASNIYKATGISDAMRQKVKWQHIKTELKEPLLYIPYLVALLAIAIITLAAKFAVR